LTTGCVSESLRQWATAARKTYKIIIIITNWSALLTQFPFRSPLLDMSCRQLLNISSQVFCNTNRDNWAALPCLTGGMFWN
jgi:hypothetical protein